MTRISRVVLIAALCWLSTGALLFAQQLSISGNIRDGSGVLPGADVTLRDPAGARKQIKSGAEGQFRFDGLKPGAYEVAVSHEGFVKSSRALTLSDEPRTVDFTMQIAGFTTSVDVVDVGDRSTGSGMNVPNRDVPSYVVSVDAETLREQGANELSAALENVSGVLTQVQYGVYEWYTIGGITQQSGNDFLYVDGMTLTGNRSATQLNNVESVQVLKGPNSILFGGSGAGQGGIVNVIRKKPSAIRSHDIQYRVGPQGMQEATGGTAGGVGNLERLLYRIDGSYSNRDGWRQNAAERMNISPSLTFLITPAMRLTTNQTFVRDRYELDAGLRRELINREGMPFDVKMNPSGDFQLSRDWQSQVVFNWNLTERLQVSNNFFSRKNRDQYLDAESQTYNATLDQVTRGYLYYQQNRRPVQNQLDLQGNYDLWGMRNRFLVRYDFSKQYNIANRTGNTPGSNNALNLPLPAVPVQAFIDGTWIDTAPEYNNFPITRRDHSINRYHAVVLQEQIYPTDWVAVNVVLRPTKFDRWTRNDGYDNGTFFSAGTEAHVDNNVKLNYRIGSVLLPQQDWPRFIRTSQPYFSVNSSFNPVLSVQPDGTSFDPVINKSIEFGNKWAGLNSRLTVLAAVRRINDQNRLVNIGNGFFEQVGATTTYNADLDIQGRIGRGFSVLANWGWADSFFDDFKTDGTPQTNAGLRFPHVPKHTARLWLGKTFVVGDATSFSVNLGGRYVSTYFLNTANTLVMPERLTFDGAASFRYRNYDLALNFINLTDRERYYVSQINSGGLLTPGPPIGTTLTLRYRF